MHLNCVWARSWVPVSPIAQSSVRNVLIRALEPAYFARFERNITRVPLSEGEVVATAGTPIDFVYFPENAVIAYLDVLGDEHRVEIGIAGSEGMTGWHILLGCRESPHDAVVRIGGGTALRLPANRLVALCCDSPPANALLMRYIGAVTVQMGRTAASNLRDPVSRRLSRWLLMCHDRLDGDEIDLTHRAIASMLGIRRASVTDGLHQLESDNIIRNHRGRIFIADRDKLRIRAGEAYGHAESYYSKVVAPFGK